MQLQTLLAEQKELKQTETGGVGELGRYRLLREVGRGGMGQVFEAFDREQGRRIALKMVLLDSHADSEEARRDTERFIRESRFAARLPKHPHIVETYDAGILDGRRYLAMEFVEGRDMSAWRKEKRVSLWKEIQLLRKVALAVHEAHKKGIIHRDLKPQNILVDEKDEPRITDFGLARTILDREDAALTKAGKVVGTPAYMSPEQARGLKTVDRRADVYSLGVILYEILTGRLPFIGGSPVDILLKVTQSLAPTPSSVARTWVKKTAGRSLDNICLRAMSKDPADRQPTAKSFAKDLESWLQGQEIPSPLPRIPRWVPAVAAGALVLVAGILAWAIHAWPSGELSALARADRLMAEGKYPEAETAYREVLSASPGNSRALAGKTEARTQMSAPPVPSPIRREAPKAPPSAQAKAPPEEAELAGPGLRVEFFDGTGLEKPAYERVDSFIDFDWGEGAAWPGGPVDDFSARWSAWLRIPATSLYVFECTSDDGVRIYLDGSLVLSHWTDHAVAKDRLACRLTSGYHRVVLEYYERTGRATVSLAWDRGLGRPMEPIGAEYWRCPKKPFVTVPAPER
jgi:hypothetical protein